MKPVVAKVLFLTEADAYSFTKEEIGYFIVVEPESVSRTLMTRESVRTNNKTAERLWVS